MNRFGSVVCAAIALFICSNSLAAQEAAAPAAGQAEPIKRTPLQRFAVPDTTYETIIGTAEIAPNTGVGRHTHPGPESGYVIEGGFELLVDGEAPITLKAGDSYLVPANVAHDAITGPDGAKVIATYLIPDGLPLAAPAK